MPHDFFKKFKFLKPPESSLGVLGCFCFSLCLILCLFLLDYSIVDDFHGDSPLMTWFKSNGSSPEPEKVGFLEAGGDGCDLFSRRWEWDASYPLYQSRDCMFLDEGFRCGDNGRPDKGFKVSDEGFRSMRVSRVAGTRRVAGIRGSWVWVEECTRRWYVRGYGHGYPLSMPAVPDCHP